MGHNSSITRSHLVIKETAEREMVDKTRYSFRNKRMLIFFLFDWTGYYFDIGSKRRKAFRRNQHVPIFFIIIFIIVIQKTKWNDDQGESILSNI